MIRAPTPPLRQHREPGALHTGKLLAVHEQHVGRTVRTREGSTAYVVQDDLSIRRRDPKIRGKRAVKAERRARRRSRLNPAPG